MDSQVLTIRYPEGVSEFRLGASTPRVGDELKRGDDEWQVIAVDTDSHGNTVVTLALNNDKDRSGAG